MDSIINCFIAVFHPCANIFIGKYFTALSLSFWQTGILESNFIILIFTYFIVSKFL